MLGGRYQIQKKLGQGGMGTVYEAMHVTTKATVAVKLLSSSRNEQDIARFEREARAAGAIASEHIVRVLDAGKDEASGCPFLVMERLVGEDLGRVLDRTGAMPPLLVVRLAAQIALGLARAHEAGVVHRDIKPSNVFLSHVDDDEVRVKLLDFGVAKLGVVEPQDATLTNTGHMLGTPHYMAPEQAQTPKTADHRADIWSLGAVMYKALTGERPHEDTESVGQTIVAIASKPVKPVQDVAPWVPAEIAALVQRCLERDPKDRFADARALLEAMRPIAGDPIRLTLTGIRGVTDEEKAHRATRAKTRGQSRKALAIALFGVAIGTVLGIVTWRSTLPKAPKLAATPLVITPLPLPSSDADAERVRTFTVAIEPPHAEVRANGEMAAVQAGHISLTGRVGSRHRVELTLDDQHALTEVVLADDGAVPNVARLAFKPKGTPVAPTRTRAALPPPPQDASTKKRVEGTAVFE